MEGRSLVCDVMAGTESSKESWAREYEGIARQGESSKLHMKYLLMFGVILLGAGIVLKSVLLMVSGGTLIIAGVMFLGFQGYAEHESAELRRELGIESTRYCTHCERAVPSDWTYCDHCGSRV